MTPPPPARRSAGLPLLLVAALVAVAGCGKSDLPPIARVTGTVTMNGKPVPNMMVNFMPTEGRPSWGRTDEQGYYEMNYDADTMGVKSGHHKVYFNSAVATIDGGASKKSRAAAAAGTGLTPEEMRTLLRKYGKEDSTQLEVDITEDPTVKDLKLE